MTNPAITQFMDRPIAFHRSFVSLGAGVTGALMLSQAVYWSHRTQKGDGWFYKTQAEWEEETGLSRYEQEGARKKLRKLGVMQEIKRGVPCKTFYKVDFQQLSMLLFQDVEIPHTGMRESSELDGGNPSGSVGENQQSITETTQRLPETTSENTKGSPADASVSHEKKSVKSKGVKSTGKYSLDGMDMSSWPEQPSTQVLTDWLAVRKEKKAIITQTAITRMGNQLTKAAQAGFTVDQCLGKAIERGWRGFEAAWMMNSGASPAGSGRPGYFKGDDYTNKNYHEGIDKDGRF